jgi:hypothetical protein
MVRDFRTGITMNFRMETICLFQMHGTANVAHVCRPSAFAAALQMRVILYRRQQ